MFDGDEVVANLSLAQFFHQYWRPPPMDLPPVVYNKVGEPGAGVAASHAVFDDTDSKAHERSESANAVDTAEHISSTIKPCGGHSAETKRVKKMACCEETQREDVSCRRVKHKGLDCPTKMAGQPGGPVQLAYRQVIYVLVCRAVAVAIGKGPRQAGTQQKKPPKARVRNQEMLQFGKTSHIAKRMANKQAMVVAHLIVDGDKKCSNRT